MKKIIAFSLFLLSLTVFSQKNSKSDLIDQLMNKYVEYDKFNGSILVANKGEVVYKNGFGFANQEWEVTNQPNTKFKIASVSKQFTAMLVMQLVAEGKLELEQPISAYLPDYPKEKADQITIHHLLTHSSGTPNYTSFPNYQQTMRKHWKSEEMMNLFKDSTLLFTPGERFSYSNSGYVLLGLIIEKVSGKPYSKVLQEKIFNPLKMNSSGFFENHKMIKGVASGYNKKGSGYVPANFIDMSAAYAAGGIYSTVEDLFIWDQALYSEKLLPKSYLDLSFKKYIPSWDQHYGYGWMSGEIKLGKSEDTKPTIEHDGSINGFNSIIIRIPEDQSTIILLNNTGGAPLREISTAIAGILYNTPYATPKKSIAHTLLATIDRQGIEIASEQYNLNQRDSSYYMDEGELNWVSYELLQSGKVKTAAQVLQLGIKTFPSAFNLYDSYGEVLATLGDTLQSIENYKKSLRLNPNNENGVRMLKKLGMVVNSKDFDLLLSDDSWASETFTFPIHFAKEIDFKGTEEAFFPRNWRKKDSIEYWSYAIAWHVNLQKDLSSSRIENDLKLYFDGLMEIVNRNKELSLPKTIAKINEVKHPSAFNSYEGTLTLHDAFITKEVITLNVSIEQHLCETQEKMILLFRFSPKSFDHDIWQSLNNMTLRNNACID